MKSLLDSTFRYRASFDTDLRKTFERIRRERSNAAKEAETNRREVEEKVERLPATRKIRNG